MEAANPFGTVLPAAGHVTIACGHRPGVFPNRRHHVADTRISQNRGSFKNDIARKCTTIINSVCTRFQPPNLFDKYSRPVVVTGVTLPTSTRSSAAPRGSFTVVLPVLGAGSPGVVSSAETWFPPHPKGVTDHLWLLCKGEPGPVQCSLGN